MLRFWCFVYVLMQKKIYQSSAPMTDLWICPWVLMSGETILKKKQAVKSCVQTETTRGQNLLDIPSNVRWLETVKPTFVATEHIIKVHILE